LRKGDCPAPRQKGVRGQAKRNGVSVDILSVKQPARKKKKVWEVHPSPFKGAKGKGLLGNFGGGDAL